MKELVNKVILSTTWSPYLRIFTPALHKKHRPLFLEYQQHCTDLSEPLKHKLLLSSLFKFSKVLPWYKKRSYYSLKKTILLTRYSTSIVLWKTFINKFFVCLMFMSLILYYTAVLLVPYKKSKYRLVGW